MDPRVARAMAAREALEHHAHAVGADDCARGAQPVAATPRVESGADQAERRPPQGMLADAAEDPRAAQDAGPGQEPLDPDDGADVQVVDACHRARTATKSRVEGWRYRLGFGCSSAVSMCGTATPGLGWV
ncbi:hypothetical protein GALL_337860 [mine drainage metagenome]|uniref:Uncharacterized protein n=1 Tax=mine drainage metagenome TaxID=410659 RepID=A0A1J5QLJ6_9ZZZZ